MSHLRKQDLPRAERLVSLLNSLSESTNASHLSSRSILETPRSVLSDAPELTRIVAEVGQSQLQQQQQMVPASGLARGGRSASQSRTAAAPRALANNTANSIGYTSTSSGGINVGFHSHPAAGMNAMPGNAASNRRVGMTPRNVSSTNNFSNGSSDRRNLQQQQQQPSVLSWC